MQITKTARFETNTLNDLSMVPLACAFARHGLMTAAERSCNEIVRRVAHPPDDLHYEIKLLHRYDGATATEHRHVAALDTRPPVPASAHMHIPLYEKLNPTAPALRDRTRTNQPELQS
ncbi:hypothetical protein [Burkholderia sp. GS2Y]|uniref:Uncharacterized protein n=1 Tax=Burkholderia theae TaxID=3143496 RepID=A0ABU9WNW8_9BURK